MKPTRPLPNIPKESLWVPKALTRPQARSNRKLSWPPALVIKLFKGLLWLASSLACLITVWLGLRSATYWAECLVAIGLVLFLILTLDDIGDRIAAAIKSTKPNSAPPKD